jgi:hypothetical protein
MRTFFLQPLCYIFICFFDRLQRDFVVPIFSGFTQHKKNENRSTSSDGQLDISSRNLTCLYIFSQKETTNNIQSKPNSPHLNNGIEPFR